MNQIRKVQTLKCTKDEIWDFISNPKNLSEITPKKMGFNVLTKPLPNKVYEGMMIHYSVKPLLGITLLWVTEITTVKDKQYFVDEQRIGPYKIWHHEHHIQELDNAEGIEMIDIISYVAPFGFIGRLMNRLFIRKQLDQIFDYRFNVLDKKYNK